MNRLAALVALLSLAITATGQLIEFPIASTRTQVAKGSSAKRTQTVRQTYLPFFDDFSSSDSLLRDSLWLYGNSVLLNNGLGIQPPSRNFVSFDGADSLGKPYNINDVLAKGFADKLVSQPIRMDLVSGPDRSTVFLSFFYQLLGRGEPPDPGDQLVLSFKAQDGTWEDVYVLETNASMDPDIFQQAIVPVAEDRFFHDTFQFRFRNYARLSGPYDTWNVDYIYLNKGRNIGDLYYPDRTISSPLSSLFKDYYAMPLRHFKEKVSLNLVHPSVELFNLKLLDSPSGLPHVQPINYTTNARISASVNGTTSASLVKLDSAQYPGADLPGLSYLTVTLNTLPDSTDFPSDADSIHIRLKYGMATKDNIPISATGDYDVAKYSPIDFRYSDSLSADFVLSSYYAYDDGTAEYGAGLNQAGSFLAFFFNMKSAGPDTLTYIDIYFPHFGDNTNQSLLLQVRDELTDISASALLEQLIVVNRSTQNKFVRYPLIRALPIGGSFYIGWKQISNASIPVGLDKNTDNGDKIYYSVNGQWAQNTLVKGSMMVRPGFGKGDGSIITGLERPVVVSLYPNPTPGVCYLDGLAERVEAFDITGRSLETSWLTEGTQTRIQINCANSGLVLVRFIMDGKVYTKKIMVLAGER